MEPKRSSQAVLQAQEETGWKKTTQLLTPGVTPGTDRPLSTELMSAWPQPPWGSSQRLSPEATSSTFGSCPSTHFTSVAGNWPPFSAALIKVNPAVLSCWPVRAWARRCWCIRKGQSWGRSPESGHALHTALRICGGLRGFYSGAGYRYDSGLPGPAGVAGKLSGRAQRVGRQEQSGYGSQERGALRGVEKSGSSVPLSC